MTVVGWATLVLELLAVVWFLALLSLWVRLSRRVEELHRRLAGLETRPNGDR